ncbi:MAG: signal recognition particle-docking protein FtsY [Candidatus Glassbacteria bacterium]|nr:signal recognition particle-docking protein FtsY [Candidatus Glassbacteria bacterium]
MSRFFSGKDVKQQPGRKSLWSRIRDVALMDVGVMVRGLDTTSIESLEELLLESDFGVGPTLRIVETMTAEGRKGNLKSEDDYRELFRREILRVFETTAPQAGLRLAAEGPTVILMVGVNGVGKTTTIAKLARRFQAGGKRVILAAGDTFRAGAVEQVERWAQRLGCELVKQKAGADPAAVAYDAVAAAVSRGADVVICDSAGRLHTQDGLMQELVKMRRVIGKPLPGAPHEVLLVLDSTIGQNSISQARIFHERLGVTGLVLAKFDGTSKAGCAVAITEELKLPIKLVGVGEKLEDLEDFDPERYLDKLLG